MILHPPRSPLFPYTTLFRSGDEVGDRLGVAAVGADVRFQGGVDALDLGPGPQLRTTPVPADLGATLGAEEGDVHVVVADALGRSEEHTSELQSHVNLVCRLL